MIPKPQLQYLFENDNPNFWLSETTDSCIFSLVSIIVHLYFKIVRFNKYFRIVKSNAILTWTEWHICLARQMAVFHLPNQLLDISWARGCFYIFSALDPTVQTWTKYLLGVATHHFERHLGMQ